MPAPLDGPNPTELQVDAFTDPNKVDVWQELTECFKDDITLPSQAVNLAADKLFDWKANEDLKKLDKKRWMLGMSEIGKVMDANESIRQYMTSVTGKGYEPSLNIAVDTRGSFRILGCLSIREPPDSVVFSEMVCVNSVNGNVWDEVPLERMDRS